MKAIVLREFGEGDKLKLEEVAEPTLHDDEVLLRVGACGVCYLDVITRAGLRQDAKLPVIPGHEIAGEVLKVGGGVRDFARGDRVAATTRVVCGQCDLCRSGRETICRTLNQMFGIRRDGAYAELIKVPSSALVKLPPEISFEEASIFTCVISTALNGVRDKARVAPGDNVLVTGAGGGLGVHAVQIARLCGARVVAVTGSEGKAARLKELGADDVVISRDGDFSKKVREVLGGQGADAVIECVGAPTFEGSFKSLAPSGRLVFLGQLTGDHVHFNPAVMIYKDIAFYGGINGTKHQLEEVVELVRRKKIKPIISAAFPLKEAAAAQKMLEERKTFGRVVIKG